MKRWLVFFIMMLNSTDLLPQAGLKNDTAYIELRSINETALRELKNKKEFQYNTTEPALSLWDKFWNWVWWKAGQILLTKEGRTTIWSLLTIFGIIAIIFFAVKITGMDQNGLFGRSNSDSLKYALSQNDIHQISFDDAIKEAIEDGNYRLAIRLHYLQVLKKLSDKGYIDWRINKTNTDYLVETTGHPFNAVFIRLTAAFEYTWYGSNQVSEGEFTDLRREFQQFNNFMF